MASRSPNSAAPQLTSISRQPVDAGRSRPLIGTQPPAIAAGLEPPRLGVVHGRRPGPPWRQGSRPTLRDGHFLAVGFISNDLSHVPHLPVR